MFGLKDFLFKLIITFLILRILIWDADVIIRWIILMIVVIGVSIYENFIGFKMGVLYMEKMYHDILERLKESEVKE